MTAPVPPPEDATTREPPAAPPPKRTTPPTLLEQLGGTGGLVASVVPVLVFVLVNTVVGLMPAIWSALAAGVAVGLWRLARKEALQPAVTGILGVALCALIAYWMGDARGFFLYGIWYSLVIGLVFTLSVVVRRPLVGVIWAGLTGAGPDWRFNRRVRFAYDVATSVWAVFFLARFGVQNWLYQANETTLLGVARLVMGLPLTAVAAVVTIWAIRRATKAQEAASPARGAR